MSFNRRVYYETPTGTQTFVFSDSFFDVLEKIDDSKNWDEEMPGILENMEGHNVPVSEGNVEILLRIHTSENLSLEDAIGKLQTIGYNPYLSAAPGKETLKQIEEGFKKDKRFNGRVPKMVGSIARVYDFLKENHAEQLEIADDPVKSFSLQTVKEMRDHGISECDAALFNMTLSDTACKNLAHTKGSDIVPLVTKLLSKAVKKQNPRLLEGARWISEHTQTNYGLLKQVAKNAKKIDIQPSDTISSITVKMYQIKAEKEVARIEKIYKKADFKFDRDVTCELKGVGEITTKGKYNAYIMDPKDKVQVLLGDLTNCCQRLYSKKDRDYISQDEGIGESAMMYGLVYSKAGFFVIDEGGEVKAQAEIWEKNEDTLVFDNIEFANDADIALYKKVLGKWLENTEYGTVQMGTGYNGLLYEAKFEQAGGIQPNIDAKTVFILSHEEGSDAPVCKSIEQAEKLLQKGIKNNIPPFTEGSKSQGVTYFDYVYCDSERSSVYLKKDGRLADYFMSDERLEEIRKIAALDNPSAREFAASMQGIDIEEINRELMRQEEYNEYYEDDEYDEERDYNEEDVF